MSSSFLHIIVRFSSLSNISIEIILCTSNSVMIEQFHRPHPTITTHDIYYIYLYPIYLVYILPPVITIPFYIFFAHYHHHDDQCAIKQWQLSRRNARGMGQQEEPLNSSPFHITGHCRTPVHERFYDEHAHNHADLYWITGEIHCQAVQITVEATKTACE